MGAADGCGGETLIILLLLRRSTFRLSFGAWLNAKSPLVDLHHSTSAGKDMQVNPAAAGRRDVQCKSSSRNGVDLFYLGASQKNLICFHRFQAASNFRSFRRLPPMFPLKTAKR